MRVILAVSLLCAIIASAKTNSPWVRGVISAIRSASTQIDEMVETLKYRNEDFLTRSFDAFINSQKSFSSQSRAALERQRHILGHLYEEMVTTKRKQEEALEDLMKQSRSRPVTFDESLESFSRLYNESLALFQLPGSRKSRQQQPGLGPGAESFSTQIDLMTRRMTSSWDTVMGAASDVSSRAEVALQSTLEDLQGLQNSLVFSAKGFLSASITNAKNKSKQDRQELVRERRRLAKRFRELEREGQSWIEQRAAQLETSIKAARDSLATSNSAYEELLSKRRASLYYTAMSDSCLSKVLKLIDLKTAKGWKLIREEDGYLVYRKFMGASGPGSQYACVMCSGFINSAPKDVFALFEDTSRVSEYNSFYAKGTDLELVAENTKISWAATPPVFPFKPRDFCTLIHTRKLKDGTFVVLNTATTHPDAPPKPGYVRGSIVLGANIIKPVQGNSRKTHLTMLTQLDPGGFAPPVAVNHICTLGPVGFMRNVEKSSQKKKKLWRTFKKENA